MLTQRWRGNKHLTHSVLDACQDRLLQSLIRDTWQESGPSMTPHLNGQQKSTACGLKTAWGLVHNEQCETLLLSELQPLNHSVVGWQQGVTGLSNACRQQQQQQTLTNAEPQVANMVPGLCCQYHRWFSASSAVPIQCSRH